MSEYNFRPNYEECWNAVDLAENDLAWLILEINPADAKKSLELSGKTELTLEEEQWKTKFGYYINSLAHGPWIGGTQKNILERKLWGNGKEDFIVNIYGRTMDIPEDFSAYLRSIGRMPDHFDHYKNHERYRAGLRIRVNEK